MEHCDSKEIRSFYFNDIQRFFSYCYLFLTSGLEQLIVYLIGYFTFKRLDARPDRDAKGFAGQLTNGSLFLNIAGHSYFILFSCQQSLQTF